jgi:hypothetical protein
MDDTGDALLDAYERGREAAARGEEAAPGCTVTAEGRAWLRGYVDGASDRGAGADRPAPPPRADTGPQ